MKLSLKRAALAALILEASILSAFAWMPQTQSPPPKQVEMISLAQEPPVEPQQQQMEEKKPERKIERKTEKRTVRKAEAPRQVATREANPAPSPQAAVAQPVAAPPVKAAPVKADAPEVTPDFRAQIRAAVQAAVVYPMGARMMHATGRVRVGFSYLDGVASDARIVASSGNGLLDRAALAAVMNASYPLPEAKFSGRKLDFELWVHFHLSAEE